MNGKSMTLNQLSVGQKAKISALNSTGNLRRRMLDLGITQGTTVEVLHKSPSGDPTAYSVRGTVIALRNEDAEKIIMTAVM
ncbi:MAG: ferrous iron transport protein A [Firmicutes bacterium]|nr:ferrous iron transport protein A [Bacillota bacterium]MBR6701460.1 ferrous iron transport protein A [Bacillota bacterium]